MNLIEKSDQYKISQSLAGDLAEEELRANIAEMMILDADKKAKYFRNLVESNQDKVDNSACREYKNARRSIYGAIYQLIDGYKGYKLVKE